MNDETELFDRYLSKEMSDEERHDFDIRLEQDEELRKAFQMHVTVIKELNKQAEKENAEFGEAMKNISEEDFDEIIDSHSFASSACMMPIDSIDNNAADIEISTDASRTTVAESPTEEMNPYDEDNYDEGVKTESSAKGVDNPKIEDLTPVESKEPAPFFDEAAKQKDEKSKIRRIKTYWITSVAAILIVGVFGFNAIKSHYDNNTDNLLVEYNAEMVSRGTEGELDVLMKNVLVGNNLDVTTKKLESIYNNGNEQDRPIAGWYLAMSYIKQHNHNKAIATLKSLQQKYPEFAMSINVDGLLSKLE
jgi:predicted negative regulator of RcsB-dependent stress response